MLGGKGQHLFRRLSDFIVFYNSGSRIYLQSILGHLILSFICVKLLSQIWCIVSLPCYCLGKSRLKFNSSSLSRIYENWGCCLVEQKMWWNFWRKIRTGLLLERDPLCLTSFVEDLPYFLSHYLKPSFCAQSTLQVLVSLVSAASISSAGPVVVGHRSFPTWSLAALGSEWSCLFPAVTCFHILPASSSIFTGFLLGWIFPGPEFWEATLDQHTVN